MQADTKISGGMRHFPASARWSHAARRDPATEAHSSSGFTAELSAGEYRIYL